MIAGNIEATYGVALVAYTFAMFLYGCVCVQTCRYHILPSEDPKCLRWSIKVLWIIETSHISFTAATIYYFLILKRMDVDVGASPLWTIGTLMIFTHVSDLLVRGIFIHRIWLLTKHNYPIVGLSWVLAFLAVGFGVACGIRLMNIAPSVILQTVTWPVYIPLTLSAAADVFISSVILMIYTASAGVFPSVIALASLMTYIIFPQTYFSIALFFVLPQATLNTMLAMLNARSSLRNVLPAKSKKLNMLQISIVSMPVQAGTLSSHPDIRPRRHTISRRFPMVQVE
ncbi:hypothetical protein PHLGIDRAFT_298149 [Phlebiopsis gigantea 11061_1 CR5-6]|uniref:DUF6534 domain-containing protein n=1 Tax=Phlebiopsis gigantea (strain 11061_1 CR5-6) TaxID=745531 RepID=A0A0C3RR08_PHLG1|nr:hypothetical protein PHLGIDRAFT_298149 [Phlebiopsis gigantea 11061_1 CR5-6]